MISDDEVVLRACDYALEEVFWECDCDWLFFFFLQEIAAVRERVDGRHAVVCPARGGHFLVVQDQTGADRRVPDRSLRVH